MDTLGALLVGAVALEAVVQLLRNIWNEDIRAEWTITRALVFVIPIVTLLVWADRMNLAADFGFDVENDQVGSIITALAAGRVAMWVHDLYAKTAR